MVPKLERRPFVLIIRDGWGANPDPSWHRANAVQLAETPVDDRLLAEFPHVLIHTSGEEVGLPAGVMGNSEVGHQNIGAGRIVDQEIMRITRQIRVGEFFHNPALTGAFRRASETGGQVHVLGLCSDGRVHSDLEHLYAVLEMGQRLGFDGQRVWVHAITDGRDTPPNSGIGFVEQIEAKCREFGVNPVASVVGRYYAMDRDNRWDRVEAAYRMFVHGDGRRFGSASEAVRDYYHHPTDASRSGDEFITPRLCTAYGPPQGRFSDGDSVVFLNFRGDRPREITKAFTLDRFPYRSVDPQGVERELGFDRGDKLELYYATMTAYETGLPVHVAFSKPPKMVNTFGGYLSKLGLRQLRCAETEKYPHVTFFFNDYLDDPFEGEERVMVSSPRDVATYDEKPEMSADEVTAEVLSRIEAGTFDVIVTNYANGDMVGHTGDLQAAIKAVETVDRNVGQILEATRQAGGMAIVTADHGNAEQMIDPATDGPHTAHTTYDVEMVVVDDRFRGRTLRQGGTLADIVPTGLDMMGLEKPAEMTGRSLLQP